MAGIRTEPPGLSRGFVGDSTSTLLRQETATSQGNETDQPSSQQSQRSGLGDRCGGRGCCETSWGTTTEGPGNVDIPSRYPSRSIGVSQDKKQGASGYTAVGVKADSLHSDPTART